VRWGRKVTVLENKNQEGRIAASNSDGEDYGINLAPGKVLNIAVFINPMYTINRI
jgi:hypothetical protein